MNNFQVNGIEIDSFPLNNAAFKITLFKAFHGKFYASLILTEKLAGQYPRINYSDSTNSITRRGLSLRTISAISAISLRSTRKKYWWSTQRYEQPLCSRSSTNPTARTKFRIS
jgi:hypothetical protein